MEIKNWYAWIHLAQGLVASPIKHHNEYMKFNNNLLHNFFYLLIYALACVALAVCHLQVAHKFLTCAAYALHVWLKLLLL
jgi:hypothetical protein